MGSGFPVVAALILMGLILAIAIWDTIKARKEKNKQEDTEDSFHAPNDEFFDDHQDDEPRL